MTILYTAFRLLSLLALCLITFLSFGNFVGYFEKIIPSYIAGTHGIILGCVVLVVSAASWGILLAIPTWLIFGRVLAPFAVGISGIPVALLSLPPQPETVVANGGVLPVVGAVACTFGSAAFSYLMISIANKIKATLK